MTSRQYRFSILNLLKSFEDERYPSIGLHLRYLGLTGLWHPDVSSKMARFKQCLFYFCIVFFLNQYIKCFLNFNNSSLLLILENAPFHVGFMKVCFFEKDYKKWVKLIRYVSQTERNQISDANEYANKIIKGYIRHSRLVTYFCWSLTVFVATSIFFPLSYKYLQQNYNCEGDQCKLTMIFDGYIPFSDHPHGYYLSLLTQNVVGTLMTAYIAGWDTMICTIMIFFTGQLRIVRFVCSQVVDNHNPIGSHKNIADCQRFYNTLVKYQKLFNDLISPSMFVYLLVISLNLGLFSIQIATMNNETLFTSCCYMFACLVQLLVFFWYGNEVLEASLLVSYGVFESEWYQLDNKYQREIALLGIATTKRLVFSVGPFHEMSLQTFVSILRGTYTFYTLLNETN